MRFSTGPALAALLLAAPTAASAQSASRNTTGSSSVVQEIDRAGEATAAKGAPGTVVPDGQGLAKAPGVVAPVETTVPPGATPQTGTANAK